MVSLKNKYLKIRLQGFLLVFSLGIILSCEEVIPELHDKASEELTIIQYILAEEQADTYSLFGEVILKAELKNLLSVRGPYTLFLPDNKAVQDYFDETGRSSVADMTPEQCKELVYNHLTDVEIQSNEIGLGALIKVNALGDYLSTEFDGSDIIINKVAKITDRDILAANGVIHVTDRVLYPVFDDVITIMEKRGNHTIFTEGLKRTGLADTLRMIDFEYGRYRARNRYTIYSVSDEVLLSEGITSIEQLINKYTSEPDKITERENGFFIYMEYHCITGTHFLNHLEQTSYPNISNENFIKITLTNDYEINKKGDDYTAFDLKESNIPAKNGVIHTVLGLLPAPPPVPWKVVFDITDYIDFRERDFYKRRETLGASDFIFQKFTDGENDFEYIKWSGDYLQYYYNPGDWKAPDYINGDCLNMSGFWSLMVTSPRIMKGKYRINAYTRVGPDCLVYIDGVLQDEIYKMSEGGDNVIARQVATVNWEESTRHTIRLACINSGMIFWDRLEFVPID